MAKQAKKSSALRQHRLDLAALGRALRSLREAQEMTQQQVADRIGVTKETVSKYESGGIEPPVNKLDAIAKLLGKDLPVLMRAAQTDNPLRAIDESPTLEEIEFLADWRMLLDAERDAFRAQIKTEADRAREYLKKYRK